jgi:hypothetical protein
MINWNSRFVVESDGTKKHKDSKETENKKFYITPARPRTVFDFHHSKRPFKKIYQKPISTPG